MQPNPCTEKMRQLGADHARGGGRKHANAFPVTLLAISSAILLAASLYFEGLWWIVSTKSRCRPTKTRRAGDEPWGPVGLQSAAGPGQWRAAWSRKLPALPPGERARTTAAKRGRRGGPAKRRGPAALCRPTPAPTPNRLSCTHLIRYFTGSRRHMLLLGAPCWLRMRTTVASGSCIRLQTR